ncbi:hypothetical protein NEOKW01_0522 [Nematocida sp. AWRm80]|nr:hypothetical protein NEOKW01_0522 [Nematocida sp. AWRm80]
MIRKSSNKLSNLFMLALALLVIIKTVFCSGDSVGDNGAPNPSLDMTSTDKLKEKISILADLPKITEFLKNKYATYNQAESIVNNSTNNPSMPSKSELRDDISNILVAKSQLQHFLSKQSNCHRINLTDPIFTQKELDMTIDAVKPLMYYLALFPYPYNPGKESTIGNISGTAVSTLVKQIGDIDYMPSDYSVYDGAPPSVQKKANNILLTIEKEMTDIIEQLKEYKNIQVTFIYKDYKNIAAQSVLIAYQTLLDFKKKDTRSFTFRVLKEISAPITAPSESAPVESTDNQTEPMPAFAEDVEMLTLNILNDPQLPKSADDEDSTTSSSSISTINSRV